MTAEKIKTNRRHIFFWGRLLTVLLLFSFKPKDETAWIRINQLGYTPEGKKVAVWVSMESSTPERFDVVEVVSGDKIFTGNTGKAFGAYGPFKCGLRLDFSRVKKRGSYYLQCGEVKSPNFRIADDVYAGTADFGLNYMREQRSGFNPVLNDSCHVTDGFTIYGPMADETRINAWGGWHDATDYLQYVTTSANATYHLLAAYRDFPEVFGDGYQANGLPNSNGILDILDEARWGLDWLLKMHPKEDWMFNQLADDRDHLNGMRLPNKDSIDYGVGPANGRPVYFASGQPQGLGKYQSRSTGVASTAGKFTSAFALGSMLYREKDNTFASLLATRAMSAYKLGLTKPGVQQTAPNRSPYFYEEDNWVDDMELGAASLFVLTGDKNYLRQSLDYSQKEKVTPWMGMDTAKHYQWYPFHNFGHYALSNTSQNVNNAEMAGYYKEGIARVFEKAKNNVFFRGIPFIWCSNNLTTSFAIQCYLYRQMSNDAQYVELEQSCLDWLFGCNPWGKSMVYGLPNNGDTPKHPHSSLNHQQNYPLDGALVDGPVYGSIYRNLRGIRLLLPDSYAKFQSDYVVYHDDVGDYSTNEPTMDGTASLIYLMAAKEHEALINKANTIRRGSLRSKKIALVFTGDTYSDGGMFISRTLKHSNISASFFLTGNFYANKQNENLVRQLKKNGNYLGSHSDKHLLYCDWTNPDSLLVSNLQFSSDLRNCYKKMAKIGIDKKNAYYFLPPFEHSNDSIAAWTKKEGFQLINFTPGTRSAADYTYPEMGEKYLDSKQIYKSILDFEANTENGLSGFILLFHMGTDQRRTDKFYHLLPSLIKELKSFGYTFERIDNLLNVKD